MDDGTILRTYGNTDLPEGTAGRPLVTFAVFAYNQEKYIREAVEGAFSQTWSPLEIILSDDCSSDRTFEIMEEMADNYNGHHCVILRRGVINRGTLGHLFQLSNLARGEILVVAAGDDISLPERVSALFRMFDTPDILAGSSDEFIVDNSGGSLEADQNRGPRRDRWQDMRPTFIHGATAAYRTSFLKGLPPAKTHLLYEDMILSDAVHIRGGKTFRLKEKLVKYRFHDQNLSSRHTKNIEETEKAAISRWQHVARAKSYCIEVLVESVPKPNNAEEVFKQMKQEQIFFELLSDWRNLDLPSRIRLSVLAFKLKKTRLVLPRLFGYRAFMFINSMRVT